MTQILNSEILFIINPNSGTKRYKHLIRRIKRLDEGIKVVVTGQNETANEIFEQYIERYRVFVVVGGDGTVHEAARHLYNRNDKLLATVPNGSGNGFAYELGFTRNLRQLLLDIRRGDTMTLDMMEMNSELCINIGGLGFDSYVAHRFSQGKTRGFLSYVVIILRSIFRFDPVDVTLVAGDREISGKFLMVCFANNRQFGNYAFIAPEARPHDGIYDIVLLKPMPLLRYPGFVADLFLRRLRNNRYLTYLRTSGETVIQSGTREYHVDGEPVFLENPVRVKISDHCLHIIRTSRNRL